LPLFAFVVFPSFLHMSAFAFHSPKKGASLPRQLLKSPFHCSFPSVSKCSNPVFPLLRGFIDCFCLSPGGFIMTRDLGSSSSPANPEINSFANGPASSSLTRGCFFPPPSEIVQKYAPRFGDRKDDPLAFKIAIWGDVLVDEGSSGPQRRYLPVPPPPRRG